MAEDHELVSLFFARAGAVDENGVVIGGGRASVTRTQRAVIFLTSTVTLLFVACAIYDPDEDYVGELRESGFGWPTCSFDAGWGDDEFCPNVFVGAALENLFETSRSPCCARPSSRCSTACSRRSARPSGCASSSRRARATSRRWRRRARARHGVLAELRRVEMEVAAILDLVRDEKAAVGAAVRDAAGEPTRRCVRVLDASACASRSRTGAARGRGRRAEALARARPRTPRTPRTAAGTPRTAPRRRRPRPRRARAAARP